MTTEHMTDFAEPSGKTAGRKAKAEADAARSRRREAAIEEAKSVLLRPLRSYEELRSAIDSRRKILGLTMLELDEKSGCQQGYSSKLIAGIKHFWPGSIDLILCALEVDLVLIERRKD